MLHGASTNQTALNECDNDTCTSQDSQLELYYSINPHCTQPQLDLLHASHHNTSSSELSAAPTFCFTSKCPNYHTPHPLIRSGAVGAAMCCKLLPAYHTIHHHDCRSFGSPPPHPTLPPPPITGTRIVFTI